MVLMVASRSPKPKLSFWTLYIFIYMNYEKIYYQIIEKRKSVPLQHNEYGEIHHIIPRSLGGDDSDINLVKLTAREHYLCHALLSEMYDVGTFEWYKMNHAFAMMRNSTTKQNRYFNSKLFPK